MESAHVCIVTLTGSICAMLIMLMHMHPVSVTTDSADGESEERCSIGETIGDRQEEEPGPSTESNALSVTDA